MVRLLSPGVIVASLLFSIGEAQQNQREDVETVTPELTCNSFFSPLSFQCEVQTFGGLGGYNPSQVLYGIINQATTVSNDTFFRNGDRISCLFRDTNFILDGFGAELGPLQFFPKYDAAGTICLFPEDIPEPKGGLTLGEIRELARTMVLECPMCGRITANFLSKDEMSLGYLKLDWVENSACIENCIDAAVDLPNSPSVDRPNNSSVIVPAPTVPGAPGAPGVTVTVPGPPGVTVPGAPGVTVPGAPVVTVYGAPEVTVPGAPWATVPGATVPAPTSATRSAAASIIISRQGVTSLLLGVILFFSGAAVMFV